MASAERNLRQRTRLMSDPNLGKEPSEADELPAYVEQLSAFHKAFAAELESVVASLPLTAGAKVLDVACGDGFYAHCFARRLAPQGLTVGVDLSLPYLQVAKANSNSASVGDHGDASFVSGDFERLPFA